MEEISAANRAELEKRYKSTLFIVSAQIFTTIILIVIVWFLTRNREVAQTENPYMTLWLVILFISAGTFLLRRQLFGWEKLKNVTLLKDVSGLIKTLQINAIILNMFAETVAILGFIIALLNQNVFDMLRAAGIALIIFAFNFPRLSVWKKIVSNLEKV
jgi:hypothetical protein